MVKTLILTPNKTEMCGMYQLAKSMDGDVMTLDIKNPIARLIQPLIPFTVAPSQERWLRKCKKYDRVISFIYPMHIYAYELQQELGMKWVCYNQKIPPINKTMFPKFWRRQYMKIFNYLNNWSMKGADEYWELSEIEQKPRWSKKGAVGSLNYAVYIGRTDDYKNFKWLKDLMEKLGIRLEHAKGSDEYVYVMLKNAKMLVTASLWEGYGRNVMEAEFLGVPAVCYDVGTHAKHVKKGIVVPVGNKKAFKKAVLKVWNSYKK